MFITCFFLLCPDVGSFSLTCVEGSKRHLPPWMMPKIGVATHLSNSGNVAKANCSIENGDISVVNAGKIDHKKYVKDYKDKETREAVGRQCNPKWQLPATKKAASTLDSSRENKNPSSLEREAIYDFSLENGEVIPTRTSQIYHLAQNMLNMLLDPLVRTTFEKEENWRREKLS
ncbi:hypothetical protein KIW84_065057 [Lathyrus oleraceus]|uniref:Uncharacterized protein n=1 Tax=Pisum sativum TaxID=3888 RepID=A0A9D4WED4_PEA|nr:hypothetical protein KIW84_065057 [Pisum sativum]